MPTETVPLRRLARCLDGRRVPLSREERGQLSGDVPYWGAGGVLDAVASSIFNEPLVLLGEDGAPFFEAGRDVAFVLDGPAWVNNHIHVLRANPGVDRRFLAYALNSVDYAAYITGSTRDKLTQDEMWRIGIPLVSGATQCAIADYLDRETARIDALIAAKRRMVELLDDRWRQHLILSLHLGGEIAPAGRRLASLAHVALGRQRTPSQDDGPHMVRYLRAANVRDGELDLEDVKEMNFTPAEQTIFALRSGDILITEGSGSLTAVGATAIYRDELEGVVCFQNTLIRMRPRPHVSAEYLLWWCRAAYYAGLFAGIAGGANIFHVSADRIKGLRSSFPPFEEQERVGARLWEEDRSFQSLRKALHAQIDLLGEHRQGLITAVVTGEVDALEAA